MRITTRRKLASLVLIAVCAACVGGCRRQPTAPEGNNDTAAETEHHTPEPDAVPPARPVDPEEEWRDEPEPQPEPEPRPEPDDPQAAPEAERAEPQDDWNNDGYNDWEDEPQDEQQDPQATAIMEPEDPWAWEQEPAMDADGQWQEWGADEEVWGESEYEEAPWDE